jgi:uncharacterized membrane protein YcaP (DUF421 family)
METVLRVAVAYLFVMVGLRLVGKRTLGELSAADLVVLMLIPELFSQAIAREDFSMTNGMVAVSSLLLLVFVTETLTYRFPKLDTLVNGRPVTVVGHGRLRAKHMDLERLSAEEIQDAMHRAGLERVEQVKWAVLYPDGTVAVAPWKQPEPGRDTSGGSEGGPI